MTLREAAEVLGISSTTLRVQARLGNLQTTHHGPIHWVTPAEVERYRREHLGRIGRPTGAKDRKPRRRQQASSVNEPQ